MRQKKKIPDSTRSRIQRAPQDLHLHLQCLRFSQLTAMHYLPNLRKIITRKKKEKPARVKLHQPLDFHAHASKASSTSSVAPPTNPQAPLGNQLRPQLIGQRVAAAVPMPKELQHWAQDFPWRSAMCAAVVLAFVVGICGTALAVAWHTGAQKPICDEACREYTTMLGETMDWSAAPCHDFYRFVCGRMASNATAVRRGINRRFINAVISSARREDVPAEGQTASQRAARLFKTCDDVVTQDTDYVPRIRGYMRDANLHWPQDPATREDASVDVLSSMLQISDKWGWPCFFEFYTKGSRDFFELTVHPTIHLELFQYHAITLGVGSPAHRRYFETLYSHYGGGIVDGVTFEEMLDYEAEIMEPVLAELFSPPDIYVYERDPLDTSGMWERWASAIRRHYSLAGNELIQIVTNKRHYFQLMLYLIDTKETILELVIGWLCVQYTSWFSNRELIANFHNYQDNTAKHHRRTCLVFTISLTGIALVVPFVQDVYTEPAREDASRIARDVRRTVYQTLDEATYPWHEIGSVFRFLDTALAHDLEARFAQFPDMEASFVKNQRDATKANRRTNLDAIGKMDPSWILVDELYRPLTLPDRTDYALKPSILTLPMYHVGAPIALRMGTFGVEVAKATIKTYEDLQYEGHRTTAIDNFRECIFAAVAGEGQPDPSDEWIARLEDSVNTAAALDVALAVLNQSSSFDDDRLRDVPLTGRQLFYVIHCYTYCGDEHGQFSCNEPLRHKADFADAFSCPPRSDMRAGRQCRGF